MKKIGLFVTAIVTLVLSLPSAPDESARAEEARGWMPAFEMTNLVCNTPAQITRFIELLGEKSQPAAIEKVNEEAAGLLPACGVIRIRYLLGPQVGEKRSASGTLFGVVAILVVQAWDPGLKSFSRPGALLQFVAMPLPAPKELEA